MATQVLDNVGCSSNDVVPIGLQSISFSINDVWSTGLSETNINDILVKT